MSITKHNWTKDEIIAIYNKPMMDLLLKQLQSIENTTIQTWFKFRPCYPKQADVLRTVVTVQAARYHTEIEGNDLMSVSQVKHKLYELNLVPHVYVWEQRGET
jgi:biotin synthase